MGKLEGKVAAITGGTRSIGRAIAEAFLREGASVVVNGRDETKGKACLDEMGGGDRSAFYAGDASKQEAVEGLVDFTIDHFGQLDVMVLNSGGVNQTAPVAQMSDEEWQFEVDWNLNQVFWGMRRSLQHMIPRQSGRILVTSSVEGKLGKPGIPGYVACKHAVNGLVKAAAHEVGTLGITVNSLLPGIIETDIVRATGPDSAVAMGVGTYDNMISMFTEESAIKRPNTVDEVAAAAVMLASDGSSKHHRVSVPGRRRNDAVLMDGPIVIAGWIDVNPEARDELIAASIPLQRSTREDEAGCVSYVIAADPVFDGRIHIYEHWATAADLDAHFQHPNFQATGELLRSQPRLGGDTSKFHVDRTGPVRDPDGSASATYWSDE